MSLPAGEKHYRMVHEYKGHHYFRVTDSDSQVVKITVGTQPKKGRSFCTGITLINYSSWSTNYAWYLQTKTTRSGSCYLKVITEEEYNKAFELVLKHLKK